MECGKLDRAENCYINALDIKHTRAHQGLARVYYLKNERKAAYEEMTKLLEKAQYSASAFEKRSEYSDREMAKNDLNMATQLDPLRTYPYRYRAAGNFVATLFVILILIGIQFLCLFILLVLIYNLGSPKLVLTWRIFNISANGRSERSGSSGRAVKGNSFQA